MNLNNSNEKDPFTLSNDDVNIDNNKSNEKINFESQKIESKINCINKDNDIENTKSGEKISQLSKSNNKSSDHKSKKNIEISNSILVIENNRTDPPKNKNKSNKSNDSKKIKKEIFKTTNLQRLSKYHVKKSDASFITNDNRIDEINKLRNKNISFAKSNPNFVMNTEYDKNIISYLKQPANMKMNDITKYIDDNQKNKATRDQLQFKYFPTKQSHLFNGAIKIDEKNEKEDEGSKDKKLNKSMESSSRPTSHEYRKKFNNQLFGRKSPFDGIDDIKNKIKYENSKSEVKIDQLPLDNQSHLNNQQLEELSHIKNKSVQNNDYLNWYAKELANSSHNTELDINLKKEININQENTRQFKVKDYLKNEIPDLKKLPKYQAKPKEYTINKLKLIPKIQSGKQTDLSYMTKSFILKKINNDRY